MKSGTKALADQRDAHASVVNAIQDRIAAAKSDANWCARSVNEIEGARYFRELRRMWSVALTAVRKAKP